MIFEDILELLFWWHHINFPFNVQEGSEYKLYWEILSKLIKPSISTDFMRKWCFILSPIPWYELTIFFCQESEEIDYIMLSSV